MTSTLRNKQRKTPKMHKDWYIVFALIFLLLLLVSFMYTIKTSGASCISNPLRYAEEISPLRNVSCQCIGEYGGRYYTRTTHPVNFS